MSRQIAIAAAVRVPLLWALVALAGCASAPGAILNGPPRQAADLPFAAFLKAAGEDYFWLDVPHSAHDSAPSDVPVSRQGLWLKAGWFYLEAECYSPKKAPHVAYPILPERGDVTVLHIRGGHRYLLSCDDYRIGRVDLADLGPLPGS